MENYRIGKYNVDGYDSETKTVYEFYGCFSHGCPRCYTKDAFNPLARKLLLSTPMSQSAHPHTTLALTWMSPPESKF
jgi:hypothetical protein